MCPEPSNCMSFEDIGNSDESTDLDSSSQQALDNQTWILELEHDIPIISASPVYTEGLWDDPEPLAEYDPDLSDPLYPEDDTTHLSHRLRIGEFISNVGKLSENQQESIMEFLEELTTTQLNNWLKWLNTKDWNGTSLLLFLEFRFEHWLETSPWWEYIFWSTDQRRWISKHNSYQLSRDAMYELVLNRIDFPSSEVIDWCWLDDWNSRQMWRHGFYSFAQFALLRSKIHPGDSWTQHINLGQSRRYAVAGFSESTPEALFASGDWYDITEWEDGLRN